MDSTTLDLGVYVVPPAEQALYQVCASVLGWDCRSERAVERIQLPGISAGQLERWVGPAAQYGPHGTIGGWMHVPAVERGRIVDNLSALCRTFAPIRLERGRFASRGDYWYPPTAPGAILVAVFDDPLGALRALHSEVLVYFNRLAVGSYHDGRVDVTRLEPRTRWRSQRYHEPRVLEDFEFHVSFATALSGADAVDRLRRAIVDTTGLFEARDHTTWTVDELVLFERRTDGFCRIATRFPLTGETV
jgi:hypothetical protein